MGGDVVNVDEKLLTAEDLAAHFGVSRRRVMEWQHIHQWPCVKVGRTFRWTTEQLKQIEALHSVKPNRSPNDPRTALSAKRGRRAS